MNFLIVLTYYLIWAHNAAKEEIQMLAGDSTDGLEGPSSNQELYTFTYICMHSWIITFVQTYFFKNYTVQEKGS